MLQLVSYSILKNNSNLPKGCLLFWLLEEWQGLSETKEYAINPPQDFVSRIC